jgi:hypothetical protein
VKLPPGEITKSPLLFSALQLAYQPAIVPSALMPSGIVSIFSTEQNSVSGTVNGAQ